MLKADAGTLAAVLSRVVPVVEYRNTIPILSCARLRVEAGVLTASSSNLDQQIDAEALVQPIGESRETAVSARRLLAVLSRLPKRDAVELALENERLFLNWNGGRVALPTLPATDFPEFNLGAGDFAEAELDGQVREGLVRCVPFMSTEETRYYLNGVCLWADPAGSRLIATDSRRLCTMPGGPSLDALTAPLRNRKSVVPRDTVRTWLGLPATAPLTMRLRHDGLTMGLRGDGVQLRSKLIDGDYPNWTRVVPDKRQLRELKASRVTLLNALSLLMAAMPHGTAVGLLVVEAGRLQLQARTHDGDVAIDVGPAAGQPLEVGVNPRLLAACVAATRGAAVTIWAGADWGAILVEGSERGPLETVVVMPLREAERPSFSAPPLAEAA